MFAVVLLGLAMLGTLGVAISGASSSLTYGKSTRGSVAHA